jgi:hypothetical protein
MLRSAYFAFFGVFFLIWWIVTDPGGHSAESEQEWVHVLWFSATLLLLGVAIALYARMIGGGRTALWAMMLGAAAAGLASVANLVEDGLEVDVFVIPFTVGAAGISIALIVATVAIVKGEVGARKLLALVPLGTVAAARGEPVLGGPAMLATWLGAAAIVPLLRPSNTGLVAVG